MIPSYDGDAAQDPAPPVGRSEGHEERPFIFISHLTVPEEDHEVLERHFRNRARLVDDFPGFLYLLLLRPISGEATHTFVTAWRSREDFSRYMKSEEHRISHSREPADIMARTEVRHEAYELLMDPAEWFGPAGSVD